MHQSQKGEVRWRTFFIALFCYSGCGRRACQFLGFRAAKICIPYPFNNVLSQTLHKIGTQTAFFTPKTNIAKGSNCLDQTKFQFYCGAGGGNSNCGIIGKLPPIIALIKFSALSLSKGKGGVPVK